MQTGTNSQISFYRQRIKSLENFPRGYEVYKRLETLKGRLAEALRVQGNGDGRQRRSPAASEVTPLNTRNIVCEDAHSDSSTDAF